MALLVTAVTMQPLPAFKGEGNPAYARNKVNVMSIVNPSGYSDDPVDQLFIPGLSNPDLRKVAMIVRDFRFNPGEDADRGYNPKMEIAR